MAWSAVLVLLSSLLVPGIASASTAPGAEIRVRAFDLAVQYRYDAGNRLDRITYPDSSNVLLGYDTLGRLETITAGTGTHAFQYDPLSQLVATQRPAGRAESTTRVS